MNKETGDNIEGKGKGEYIRWRPEESKLLIELAADCFKRGLIDPNGRMLKETVETKILPVLNKTFKCKKTYKHYINRMKILKNIYRDSVNLQRFNSKFEWNPIMKKFTAPDEVWIAYFKDYPNHRHMFYKTYEEYEHMKLVFGKRRFERSPSQACKVGKSEKLKQVDLSSDDKVHESMEVVVPGTSIYLENFVGNPDQEGRTDDDASVTKKDDCTELRSIDSATDHIMQGRSMAEKKMKNVWDALKEIPNLANTTRYQALNMILKLEMRDIFVNMSIEDRLGWIQCTIQ
ncbi:unnamed protein product [Arabidopsis lyrata]|uniref:uncharacterized protein At2g29880 n=1 Tax=Arabidopsis lyrata subsp. lyrata TaxID=81972 RepID=UPI000A29AA3F|nr:uncharacterized protein At2g29880 [Arabidopsis lyrata subsp. lyrata]XP_020865870.1 uncharacterized protein At2g29880 [Arabidopsis lyrata subsp. lyrata]CAH8256355.1 unnamed protein product [Arabidopsis lyrata]|eukprot:XP_020865868.1 uncharacterized protein At2g29880 [Arabidopsis lyrata subsp. lyrata]